MGALWPYAVGLGFRLTVQDLRPGSQMVSWHCGCEIRILHMRTALLNKRLCRDFNKVRGCRKITGSSI